MADLTLTFTLKDGKRWKEGRFEIDGISIIDVDDDLDIEYDNLELFVDGEPYDGSASNWAGQTYSADSIFNQVLSSYLHDDGLYTNFSENWDVLSRLEDLKEYENGLLVKFPVYDWDGVSIYELDLATPKCRYYSCEDRVLMLDDNNEVVTDVGHFWLQGIEEDITAILKGEVECLYMGYNAKAMIEEMGGEEAWLEELG